MWSAAATRGLRGPGSGRWGLGGLAPRMPRLTWLWLSAALALLGLPFTGSFPAGAMIYLGAIKSQPAAAFAVAGGLVIAAAILAPRDHFLSELRPAGRSIVNGVLAIAAVDENPGA